jgi:predicted GNAT family N-acyltransferase
MNQAQIAALETAQVQWTGTPWHIWAAQRQNEFWARSGRNVSSPNFRPETIRHGEQVSP